MAKRVQHKRESEESQTEDRASILYEAKVIRRNNDGYWNYNAVYIGWRCNIFTCCAATWNIFVDDKRKSYDVLRKENNNYERKI